MTLPSEITTGTLTWDIASLVRDGGTGDLVQGDLSAGSITFTATPKLLLDQGVTNLILLPAPITTPMTAGQQELILTDCAAVSPSGWTWVATPTLPGGLQMDPIPFELTSADLDVNGKARLSVLTPLPQTNGVPITRGLAGPPGGTMVLTDNGNGTATFSWDQSGTPETADVPTLSGGKLDPGTLPALAVVSVFTVSSQAAMLALDAQQGDIAVRTDEGNKYILTTSDPTVLANWVLLVSSAFTSSEITDATTVGRTILTAANAAAVNTALGLGTAALVNTGSASGDVPVLGAGGVLAIGRLATGTPNGTQFVRDDGTLSTPTLSKQSGSLAADVTLGTSATTLFTISGLAAGTWLILAGMTVLAAGTGRFASIQAVAGSGAPTLSGKLSGETQPVGTSTDADCHLMCLAICTAASTVTIQATSNSASGVTAKASTFSSGIANATGWVAIKIA